MCRKEIEVEERVARMLQARERPWSFNFYINTNLFSWLPNISIQIGNTNAAVNNENNNNNLNQFN
jgi:hypothetical protein